jgi:hypothetical protein
VEEICNKEARELSTKSATKERGKTFHTNLEVRSSLSNLNWEEKFKNMEFLPKNNPLNNLK